MTTFREIREQQLRRALNDLRTQRELPQAGTELAAYADLVEARVFAKECDQTVEEWFSEGDFVNEPEWAAAYALHLELNPKG